MAITLAQAWAQKDQTTSVASTTLAYPSNVNAGDLLICVVRGASTLTGITITDSQGNTWTNCTFQAVGGAASLQISYAVAGSTGANTVTITPNANSTLRIAIGDYSGTATSSPLDAENNTQSSNNSSPAAVSITPAANNELVIGAAAVSGSETFTAGANFTLEEQVPAGANGKLGVEDWIQTTATATTAPQTLGASDTWLAAIAVFKAASAAGLLTAIPFTPGDGGTQAAAGNVVNN